MNTKNTMILWLAQFKNVDDVLMMKAVKLCLENYKRFPTVADIKEAVKEIRYISSLKQTKQIAYTPKPSKIAERFFAMQNDSKQLKEHALQLDITELANYARTTFPNLTDEFIRENYCEIVTAKNYEDMCFNCRIDPSQCLTGGFGAKLMVEDGRVKVEMVKCRKAKSAWRESI